MKIPRSSVFASSDAVDNKGRNVARKGWGLRALTWERLEMHDALGVTQRVCVPRSGGVTSTPLGCPELLTWSRALLHLPLSLNCSLSLVSDCDAPFVSTCLRSCRGGAIIVVAHPRASLATALAQVLYKSGNHG